MSKDTTVSEHIRNRLLSSAYVIDVNIKTTQSPIEILDQEMDWDFLTKMAYGMIMGFFRYGPASCSKRNNLREIKRRLKLYEQTGNTEHLRDVANFTMQEYRNPSIKGASFRPTDDAEHAKEW